MIEVLVISVILGIVIAVVVVGVVNKKHHAENSNISTPPVSDAQDFSPPPSTPVSTDQGIGSLQQPTPPPPSANQAAQPGGYTEEAILPPSNPTPNSVQSAPNAQAESQYPRPQDLASNQTPPLRPMPSVSPRDPAQPAPPANDSTFSQQ